MKEIPLTQGQVVLVDNWWFEYLNQWKWCALWLPKKKDYYAVRIVWNPKGSTPKCRMIRMHRLIMKAEGKVQVDHRNNKGLDNQEDNLRLATHAQNMMNRTVSRVNISGSKGVYFRTDGRKNPWETSIKVDRRTIWLGSFATRQEAVQAHNEGARKYHKEFANIEQ